MQSPEGYLLASEQVISSKLQLQDYVRAEVSHWSPRSVVLLSGALGAGKTEFVKQWGQVHGLANISSPTYALHHQYIGADHFDSYRLDSEDELETTGFWDLFSSKQGLIFIEWPEKMQVGQIPKSWGCFWYQLVVTGENTRILKKFIRL